MASAAGVGRERDYAPPAAAGGKAAGRRDGEGIGEASVRPDGRGLDRHQASGTTAVASISTRALGSTSRETSTADIAGKWRAIASR